MSLRTPVVSPVVSTSVEHPLNDIQTYTPTGEQVHQPARAGKRSEEETTCS